MGPESTQQGVFATVGLPLVRDVLTGKNCLLFTYGNTGSGKTFTVLGTPEAPGILPRALDVIFNSIAPAHYEGPAVCPRYYSDVGFLDQHEAAIMERVKEESLTLHRLVSQEKRNVPHTC